MKPKYKFGLVGHKISYSLSPGIFDAIYDYLGVDGSYKNFDLTPDEFESAFDKRIFADISGLSVTIPYKKAMTELLDRIDPAAEMLQAVNSVAIREGTTFGTNTDWIGFAQPLKTMKARIEKQPAMILGYGGVARAVIYSLYQNFDVRQMTVAGRDLSAAKQNLTGLQNKLSGLNLEFIDDVTPQGAPCQKPAIVVNCTPLGGWNYPNQSPLPGDLPLSTETIYYDLNYNSDNRTIARYRKDGVTAIDGSAMLVAQALESFRLWTGDVVPFGPIYEAVFSDR